MLNEEMNRLAGDNLSLVMSLMVSFCAILFSKRCLG